MESFISDEVCIIPKGIKLYDSNIKFLEKEISECINMNYTHDNADEFINKCIEKQDKLYDLFHKLYNEKNMFKKYNNYINISMFYLWILSTYNINIISLQDHNFYIMGYMVIKTDIIKNNIPLLTSKINIKLYDIIKKCIDNIEINEDNEYATLRNIKNIL